MNLKLSVIFLFYFQVAYTRRQGSRPPAPRGLELIRIKFRGRTFDDTYCYGDDPKCGEDTWPGTCQNGETQSPIDLPPIDSLTTVGVLDKFSSAEHVLDGFILVENGFNLDILPRKDDPIQNVQFGFPQRSKTYKFFRSTFHWGDQNDIGSEHSINGKKFALELQLVYYSIKYDTYDAAAHSETDEDALAVISILFEYDPNENPSAILKPVTTAIEKLIQSGEELSSENKFNVNELFRFTEAYWYLGSEAVPPCHQNIIWFVSPTPIKISGQDLEVFRKIKGFNEQPIKIGFRRSNPIKKHSIHRIGIQYAGGS